MKLLTLLLICCICGYAYAERFEVDKDIPYKLYIGENKTIDWILVCSVFNVDFEPIFEDKSPILEIYDYPEHSSIFIIKEHSKWFYWYGDEFGVLILMSPPYWGLPMEKRLIYKR